MGLFYLLIALKVILLGAVYGRLDGGGIAKVSEWVERSLIMFFFVLACAPFAGLWGLLAYAGVLGIATGHGQYFLSLTVKAISHEKVDLLARLIFGEDPRTKKEYAKYRDDNWPGTPQKIKDKIQLEMQDYGLNRLYWRSVFGMFLTGSLVGLPAFVIAMCFGQWAGVLFLLTGVVKAIAYVIGYRFWRSTEPAEYINGGLRNALCLAVVALVLAW